MGTNDLAEAIEGYDLGQNRMLDGWERAEKAASGTAQVAGTLAGGLKLTSIGIDEWKVFRAKGHTGRYRPNNLHEQLAMEEALSRPFEGKTIVTSIDMNDPRWPGSEGWVKKAKNINGVEIHYNINLFTGQIRDAKFIDKH